ncbi:probable 3-hydroxyisobutyryl-CoA hydrolase 3 isoform X2 [Papaver somniferum]|uniref:probable 3-hydroxyisobutyryl-CoA hydrolase 3 isoform X2 n=1 Tax=Papaver somniferum TaxID=3469 RepID=UPI000E6F9DC8|nr:probable 3-hydroxyisobutyryl-CoA hydrolase 3 isoform X2 [Papaver somniferum]
MATHGAVVDHVLVEENLHARTIILNRAHRLNALSYQMVSRLHEVYTAREKDPEVKLVILRGKGKAFCVGGDVSEYFYRITEGHWKLGAKILENVITLMYKVATLGKPQVSILNGMVMGAGCGISIHGRFRVVTEKTVFAMPEASIGVIPDVGASYFLSRLPGFFGEYIGLTGARLDGTEMLACGLATHFVPSIKLSLLDEALNKVNTSDPVVISKVIDEFSEKPPLKEGSAYHRLDIIDRCFSQKTVENVISALVIWRHTTSLKQPVLLHILNFLNSRITHSVLLLLVEME